LRKSALSLKKEHSVTPAINFLKKHNITFTPHEYSMELGGGNYGQDVADALGVEHHRLFKTLLVSLNQEPKNLAVCIIPVSKTLNLKQAAKAFKAKKAEMANPDIAQKTTGYVVGGISPFGQKKRLPTALDASALDFNTVYTSGGKRGLQIEFSPSDLVSSLNAATFQLID
jgi:Cys-tRNA(Pro)/Cys-tRNA(Cys) deacylase